MLPYSADVLVAVLAQMNRDLWPLHPVVAVLVLLALGLAARPPGRGGERAIAPNLSLGLSLGLALAWGWCALGYQGHYMAPLDFLAPVHALAYGVEAALWLIVGVFAGRLSFRLRNNFQGVLGAGLVLIALVGVPLLAWAMGRAVAAVPVVGLAPGPTALMTLGFLLLADSRRLPLALAVVPVLWTLFSGYRAFALGLAEAWVLPVPGLAALVLQLQLHTPCAVVARFASA